MPEYYAEISNFNRWTAADHLEEEAKNIGLQYRRSDQCPSFIMFYTDVGTVRLGINYIRVSSSFGSQDDVFNLGERLKGLLSKNTLVPAPHPVTMFDLFLGQE